MFSFLRKWIWYIFKKKQKEKTKEENNCWRIALGYIVLLGFVLIEVASSPEQ